MSTTSQEKRFKTAIELAIRLIEGHEYGGQMNYSQSAEVARKMLLSTLDGKDPNASADRLADRCIHPEKYDCRQQHPDGGGFMSRCYRARGHKGKHGCPKNMLSEEWFEWE